MGKYAMALILTAALLMGICAGAVGQEMVSITQLYEQVQEMDGRWQKSYETPNGTMEVDVPVVVPDIEEIPVVTVERAIPLSDELFETILQGRPTPATKKGAVEYEIDVNEKALEFFLGYVEYGQDKHEALDSVWIQRGGYRFSVGFGAMGEASPVTVHYPWEIEMDQPYLRGSEQTIDDVMRIWEEDIRLSYPDGEYVVKPKHVKICGSTLMENTGTDEASKRDGYYEIWAEQYICGLPLFGAVSSLDADNYYAMNHESSDEANRATEKLHPYRIGAARTMNYLLSFSSNEEDNRTMTELDNVRTIEMADVPLASLQSVQAAIEKEIEAGHIRQMYSMRLGYLLYSNPGMDDYAWAVPRWVVECDYITKDNEKKVEDFHEFDPELELWDRWEFLQMPVDAQNAELIIFTVGDEQTFSVPEILTWDDMK